MKSINILLTMMAATVLCGGYGAKAQDGTPSKRHVYFSETFSGTAPRYDTTVWNLEADTGYRRMFYSATTESGGRSPEAVWGYVPDAGLNVVLHDTLRFVTKPLALQAASRSYVSMKYLYKSLIVRATPDGLRSFGLAARQPGGGWMPCGIVGSGGLEAKIGGQLTAELPAALKDAPEVEVCVYLQNRIDMTEIKNYYMLYFDDIECYAYPEAYHDLAFSWSGRPYEFTGFTVDTVDFIVSDNDTVGVVTDTVYELLDVNLQVENIGNTLKSCKVAYTFDGGAVQYLDLTFDSPLLPGQTHTVVGFEPEGWAQAAEGHHAVVFWLAEADGVALAETEAVKQRKFISKLDPETLTAYAYKPLVEEFSSSSCVTCAPRNKSLQPVFNELGDRISVVKYQMNFPGTGDPYYTGDGGQRKLFYNIQSVPEIYLNGRLDPTSGGASGMRLRFMEKIDAPAFFNITLDTLALDADTNLYVAFKVRSSLPTGNVRLHAVVLEKQTVGNATSNGETEFHHVMLKMLPDGNGLAVNLDPDSVYTFRYAYGMKKTFMEEADDLAVICFLQADNDTVLQSAIGDVTMRIDASPVWPLPNDRSAYVALTAYPNPASEEVLLPALDRATVEVFNMAGRRVFHQYGVQGDCRLNVRDFRPGVYVVRVVETNRTAWAKISVVR